MRSTLSRPFLALTSVIVVLLAVGTIWDHAISQTVHDQSNPFGILLAAYGEAPAALFLVVAGTLLILARNRERTVVAVGQIVGGGVLASAGTAMVLFMPGRYLDANAAVLAGIGLVLVVGVVVGSRRLAKDADRRTTVRIALVLFLVVLVEMVLVNVLKVVWERPRLRFLAENPDIAFQPWFVIGNDAKETLIASGVDSEEFKSFPSGHTANAATLMLLVVIAPLRAALDRHRTTLLWIGAAWGLLVALSRVIMGAHFVSDTVVGFAITFVLVAVAQEALRRRTESAPTLEAVSP